MLHQLHQKTQNAQRLQPMESCQVEETDGAKAEGGREEYVSEGV